MKVIFIDIDGVLNSMSCKAKFEGLPFVEDEKILLLKEIIDYTGAKVVLSSTWRYGWYAMEHIEHPDESDLRDIRMFKTLCDKLQKFGIELLGYTEDFGRCGEEISACLKDWQGEPIESYVVLDDMGGDEIRPHCKYLVQTNMTHGLQANCIKQVLKILDKNSANRS